VGLNQEDDLVQGIVIIRGENPCCGHKLKEKIEELNQRILPANVKIEPVIDRTKLVNNTVHTVSKT
jgi:cobalt-zinc-cadmium resistance protein CzcA